jgi:3',5'-cyclic-AMP phosphodiesterase
MRLAWLTDIHLNFLPIEQSQEFLRLVRSTEPDAVLISGDIAEAHDLRRYLELIDQELARPIYFVLGNHDFYHGSIVGVREMTVDICERHPRLHYLTHYESPIELTPSVALVGHDGWADGRIGSYETSIVQMTDWQLITDFIGRGKLERWPTLQSLGDEAATHLRRVLLLALEKHETAIVLTHVPPFREACWHQGQLSNDDWAPHFACKAVGDALLDIARTHPHRRIEVYCGHTHGAGKCRPLRNLHIHTGGADYGTPQVQKMLEL